MKDILIVLAVIFAIIDWIAVARDSKKLEYFAKPAALAILILWLVLVGGFELPMFWFSIGLVFCLAGDVFLMLPNEKFILGLLAFLTGHIFYTIGFNTSKPAGNLPILLLAAVIFFVDIRVYPQLVKGCDLHGLSKLRLPVLFYAIVISLMLLSALSTLVRADWQISAAMLVSAGALLFFFSDILLACNRFIQYDRRRRILNLIAYHLGQFGIVLGAAIQYSLI